MSNQNFKENEDIPKEQPQKGYKSILIKTSNDGSSSSNKKQVTSMASTRYYQNSNLSKSKESNRSNISNKNANSKDSLKTPLYCFDTNPSRKNTTRGLVKVSNTKKIPLVRTKTYTAPSKAKTIVKKNNYVKKNTFISNKKKITSVIKNKVQSKPEAKEYLTTEPDDELKRLIMLKNEIEFIIKLRLENMNNAKRKEEVIEPQLKDNTNTNTIIPNSINQDQGEDKEQKESIQMQMDSVKNDVITNCDQYHDKNDERVKEKDNDINMIVDANLIQTEIRPEMQQTDCRIAKSINSKLNFSQQEEEEFVTQKSINNKEYYSVNEDENVKAHSLSTSKINANIICIDKDTTNNNIPKEYKARERALTKDEADNNQSSYDDSYRAIEEQTRCINPINQKSILKTRKKIALHKNIEPIKRDEEGEVEIEAEFEEEVEEEEKNEKINKTESDDVITNKYKTKQNRVKNIKTNTKQQPTKIHMKIEENINNSTESKDIDNDNEEIAEEKEVVEKKEIEDKENEKEEGEEAKKKGEEIVQEQAKTSLEDEDNTRTYLKTVNSITTNSKLIKKPVSGRNNTLLKKNQEHEQINPNTKCNDHNIETYETDDNNKKGDNIKEGNKRHFNPIIEKALQLTIRANSTVQKSQEVYDNENLAKIINWISRKENGSNDTNINNIANDKDKGKINDEPIHLKSVTCSQELSKLKRVSILKQLQNELNIQQMKNSETNYKIVNPLIGYIENAQYHSLTSRIQPTTETNKSNNYNLTTREVNEYKESFDLSKGKTDRKKLNVFIEDKLINIHPNKTMNKKEETKSIHLAKVKEDISNYGSQKKPNCFKSSQKPESQCSLFKKTNFPYYAYYKKRIDIMPSNTISKP